jgi:hypothetical protein
VGLVIAFSACTVTVGVTSVTLDKSAITISAIGGTDSLYAVVDPWIATDTTVAWSSSDETIVTVAADTADAHKGILTGVAAGTADVTVTTTDGGFTASCTVTVNTEGYEITGTAINIRQDVSTTQTPPAGGTIEVTTFGSTTAITSATVAADGTFSLSDVPAGEHIIKLKNATLNSVAWVGVPVSVNISGNISGLGVLAYDSAGLSGKALIITTWSNKEYDVDSYSVIDNTPFGDGTPLATCYFSGTNKNIDITEAKVDLERDVTLSNITAGSYPVETTVVSSLATNIFLRFYAQVYTSGGSVSGNDSSTPVVQPAGINVHVMYNGAHYGTWYAPLNTAEAGVGFVKMRGNANGSITIASFNWDGNDITTGAGGGSGIRSIAITENLGVMVDEIN